MAAFEPFDTAAGYSFYLDVDGITTQLAEVSNLASEVKVIDVKHQLPDGKYAAKKVPGRSEGGTFTMKRGLTDDKQWQDWYKLAQEGKIAEARKTGSLVVNDYSGTEVMRFNFENAWISKLDLGAVKAGDTSPLMETATVAYEILKPGGD